MYTGWREKDGNRYYYNSYGYLITNDTVIIDGVNCRFDTSGRLLNDVPAKIAEIVLIHGFHTAGAEQQPGAGTVVDLRSGLWLSLVCQFRDSLMSRHREEPGSIHGI